jgi:hypothetical protein
MPTYRILSIRPRQFSRISSDFRNTLAKLYSFEFRQGELCTVEGELRIDIQVASPGREPSLSIDQRLRKSRANRFFPISSRSDAPQRQGVPEKRIGSVSETIRGATSGSSGCAVISSRPTNPGVSMSYRAVDSTGATIDFLLSALRDAAAAKRLFRKALSDPSHPPAPRHQY